MRERGTEDSLWLDLEGTQRDEVWVFCTKHGMGIGAS